MWNSSVKTVGLAACCLRRTRRDGVLLLCRMITFQVIRLVLLVLLVKVYREVAAPVYCTEVRILLWCPELNDFDD
jgi:hypothetical protein